MVNVINLGDPSIDWVRSNDVNVVVDDYYMDDYVYVDYLKISITRGNTVLPFSA